MLHPRAPVIGQSSKLILTLAYELCPCLVAMVQNQSFSGKVDKNPYLHLQEFEQTCDCLRIEGMSNETLRWKLFPFSLKERAKNGIIEP
jgi:nitrogen fixation protein FixH